MRFFAYLFGFWGSEQRQFCRVRSNIRAATSTAEYLRYINLVCVSRKKIFQRLSWGLVTILGITSSVHAQTITQQPTSQTVQAGQTAVFSVGFSGGPCRSYWYTGAIGNQYGAYGPSPIVFSIPNATTAMNGTTVQVNLYGCTGGSANVTSGIASLTVVASQSALTVSTTSLPNATESVAYSQSLAASGGTSPYSWSLSSGSLPTGMTLSSSGAISGTPTVAGSSSFTVAAKDSTGASASANLSINAATAAVAPPVQSTIWPSTAMPTTPDVGSDSPVELGVRFYADTPGYINGIRFYKSAANTGTHIGNLWSSAGTLLATATFTSETASGWQQVNFSKPVAITANTAYVASYHTTIGHYSGDAGYFASAGVNRSPLHTYANTSATPDGPYAYGSGSAFPTNTYKSANYWVDVVFAASASGGGGSALKVSTTSMPNATQSVAYRQSLAASGGTSPYSWSLSSGSLPTGMTLSSSGAISGTPTVAGSSSFTVAAKDSTGASASANLSINVVTAAAPSVSISSPASGATVSGTVSVSGVASDGLAISSVQVSVDGGSFANATGTTSWSYNLNSNSLSNGAHTLSAKVSDSGGQSATSSLVDITVNNASTSTNCTLFASPSGSSSNSGSSPSAPKSFAAAAAATQPGSVVCLLGGTYNLSSSFSPPVGGSPSSWIVYKNYDSTPVNFVWTGGSNASAMFYLGGGSFPSGPAYLEFRGLNMNGNANAADGFFCRGGHHLRFISNSISNTGGSGIASINCDYLTADHNLINHNGYIPSGTANPGWYSWTSAISYNSNQWFDNYSGFHNIISNNIITGEVDQSPNHTDGNGIILDLSSGSYDPSTANTPPALIVNNSVYGNGGRCIVAYVVTNFWIVNNTCFKNTLDTSEANFGSIEASDSHDGYVINNIAVAYATGHPPYEQRGTISNLRYYKNLGFGAANNFSYSDPSQFLNADPLFLNPPLLNAGGFVNALAPSLLGNGLSLLPLSPAIGTGIDPSTLSGIPSAIASDLKKYIYSDINGNPRPAASFDLGADQH